MREPARVELLSAVAAEPRRDNHPEAVVEPRELADPVLQTVADAPVEYLVKPVEDHERVAVTLDAGLKHRFRGDRAPVSGDGVDHVDERFHVRVLRIRSEFGDERYVVPHRHQRAKLGGRRPGHRIGQGQRQVPGQRRLARPRVAEHCQSRDFRQYLEHRLGEACGVLLEVPAKPIGVQVRGQVVLADLPASAKAKLDLPRRRNERHITPHALRDEYGGHLQLNRMGPVSGQRIHMPDYPEFPAQPTKVIPEFLTIVGVPIGWRSHVAASGRSVAVTLPA